MTHKLPYKVYSKTFVDYGYCYICRGVNLPIATFRKQWFCIDCYIAERRAQNKRIRDEKSKHINEGFRRRYRAMSPEKKEAYLVNQRKRRKTWRSKVKNDPVAYAKMLKYESAYRKSMNPEQKIKYNNQKRNSSRRLKLERNQQTLLNLKHKLDNDERN